MGQTITTEDFINFLVDCKGYGEEEAEELVKEWGVKCIAEEDFLDFYSFIE